MKKVYLLVVFTLIYIVLGISTNTKNAVALSIAPPMPDPWFALNYKIDISTLPASFYVKETKSDNPTLGNGLLYNQSDYPLYFVQNNTTEKIYENSELPQKYIPVGKLTKENYFFYHELGRFSSNVGIYESGWQDEIFNYAVLQHTYKTYFKDTKNKYADDRPHDVTIPNQEVFEIITYYKDQEIKIPVIVSYSLNENYNPNKLKQEQGSSHKRNLINMVLGIGMYVTVGLLMLFIIYKSFTKWKNLWGVGLYLIMSFLLMITSVFNISVYRSISNNLPKPAEYIIENLTPKIFPNVDYPFNDGIMYFFTNIILFALLGWIIRKLYLKIRRTNNIQNGTKT